MIVTTSNQLIGVTPTIVLDGAAGEVPANLTNPDHSFTYTSGTATDDFIISFGAQANISYVAISGHNAALTNDGTVSIYDGVTLVQSVTISRNHNLMFTFDLTTFTDLRVSFAITPNNQATTVSFIAAGTYLVVPRGEQAGYSRQWLERHVTSQTSTNLLVGPTGVTQKRKALTGSLVIPNQTIDFIETQWQSFIDFSYDQPFFIKEDDSKPESTYICYNPKHKITAHPLTRSLANASMQFNSYNGL
jgi:hypothetical protein